MKKFNVGDVVKTNRRTAIVLCDDSGGVLTSVLVGGESLNEACDVIGYGGSQFITKEENKIVLKTFPYTSPNCFWCPSYSEKIERLATRSEALAFKRKFPKAKCNIPAAKARSKKSVKRPSKSKRK